VGDIRHHAEQIIKRATRKLRREEGLEAANKKPVVTLSIDARSKMVRF